MNKLNLRAVAATGWRTVHSSGPLDVSFETPLVARETPGKGRISEEPRCKI
jgi:hypothetical protein